MDANTEQNIRESCARLFGSRGNLTRSDETNMRPAHHTKHRRPGASFVKAMIPAAGRDFAELWTHGQDLRASVEKAMAAYLRAGSPAVNCRKDADAPFQIFIDTELFDQFRALPGGPTNAIANALAWYLRPL